MRNILMSAAVAATLFMGVATANAAGTCKDTKSGSCCSSGTKCTKCADKCNCVDCKCCKK